MYSASANTTPSSGTFHFLRRLRMRLAEFRKFFSIRDRLREGGRKSIDVIRREKVKEKAEIKPYKVSIRCGYICDDPVAARRKLEKELQGTYERLRAAEARLPRPVPEAAAVVDVTPGEQTAVTSVVLASAAADAGAVDEAATGEAETAVTGAAPEAETAVTGAAPEAETPATDAMPPDDAGADATLVDEAAAADEPDASAASEPATEQDASAEPDSVAAPDATATETPPPTAS